MRRTVGPMGPDNQFTATQVRREEDRYDDYYTDACIGSSNKGGNCLPRIREGLEDQGHADQVWSVQLHQDLLPKLPWLFTATGEGF